MKLLQRSAVQAPLDAFRRIRRAHPGPSARAARRSAAAVSGVAAILLVSVTSVWGATPSRPAHHHRPVIHEAAQPVHAVCRQTWAGAKGTRHKPISCRKARRPVARKGTKAPTKAASKKAAPKKPAPKNPGPARPTPANPAPTGQAGNPATGQTSATAAPPSAPPTAVSPSQPAGASAWDEPALVDPTVVTLSDSNRSLTLSQSQDYIVKCPQGQFDVSGKITIWGGHNVVFQDCDEYVTNPSGDWAGYVEDQTGTLWIHDVHFGGAHLTGGVQMSEPGATVVMRDVLFDNVYGSYTTNHAECVQTWSGPARFLIDGLQCPTTYQGLFLAPNQIDSTTLETTWDFRNVQIDGDGAYDLWLSDVQPSNAGVLPGFNLENVYDCGTGEPRDWDSTSDGSQAWSAVKSCPPAGVPAPVWSNPDGSVTGVDDGVSPAAIAGEQP